MGIAKCRLRGAFQREKSPKSWRVRRVKGPVRSRPIGWLGSRGIGATNVHFIQIPECFGGNSSYCTLPIPAPRAASRLDDATAEIRRGQTVPAPGQGPTKKAAARCRAAASMHDVVRQFAEYAPMSLGEPRVTRAVKSFGT